MNTILRLRFPCCILIPFVCAFFAGPLRAEDEIEKAFRDALYAEEVKGDAETALKAYQEVGAKFEQQRDMAATALFRQGECLRKLGRKDEAAAIYNKILAQYPDKERVAKLSRENLAALGQPATSTPAAPAESAGMTEEEAKELTRLKVLAENSPDLLDQAIPAGPGPPGSSPTTGPPALDAAAMKGQTPVVAWLLQNVKNPSPERLTRALEFASRNGHLKVCELLLDAGGADPNKGGPLVSAIQNKRVAVARLLLARKADPNQKGFVKPSNVSWALEAAGFKTPVSLEDRRFGEGTPLFAAVSGDLPPDVVSELIKAGADVNTAVNVSDDSRGGKILVTPYPVTPLGAAILQRDAEKIGLLLAAKADVNQICNDLGATPLLVALSMRADRQSTPAADAAADAVIEQLIAAGADWKLQLTNGVTALHVAAKGRNSRWVEAALQAELDVNAVDRKGYTALHFAAETSALECLQKLLAAGAKVDAVTTDDWRITPLGTACLHLGRTDANLEILQALLDAKADPNASYARGEPVLNLLMPWGNDDRRWPEAAILLSDRGGQVRLAAQPEFFNAGAFQLQPDNSQSPDGSGQNQVSPERILAAFRVLWKAAHRRDNPRLPHAVWLDDGEPLLRFGSRLAFTAKFCDEGLKAAPSLRIFLRQCPELFAAARAAIPRDWTKVAVTRLTNQKEEVIPVDVLALIAESEKPAGEGQKVQVERTMPGDFALQWGDAISIPHTENTDPAPSGRVKEWCRQDRVVKVRIELPGGGLVTNAAAGGEPLWISTARGDEDYPTINRELLLQEAGLQDWPLKLTVKHKHMNEAGIMETLTQPLPLCYHGDILTLEPPGSSAKMSENALRAGIWLCQSMDGPFWEIPARTTTTGESVPLGGLLLALLGPHPLPVPLFDWDKALVRRWNSGEPTRGEDPFAEPAPKLPAEWTEEKLLTVWPDCKVAAGTILILPSATADSFEPPAELRAALTKKFSLNWQMKIGGGPLLDSRWEPRFFRAENKDGRRIWRDLDPGAAGSPVVPSLENLLRAGEFKMDTEGHGVIGHPGGGHRQLHDFTALLTQSGSQLTLPAADPPAQSAPAPANLPPRRNVVSPTP